MPGHQLFLFTFIRVAPHPEIWVRSERKGAAVLGLTKSRLGSNFASLALSWAEQEPTWARQVGPKLGPCWPKFGPMLRPCRIEMVHLDDFGPICTRCKLPQSRALFDAPLCRKCPSPKLEPYQSDRLAAKLTRLGTFGAGGFVSNLD